MTKYFKYLICLLVTLSCKQKTETLTEDFNSHDKFIDDLETKIEIAQDVDYKSLFLNNIDYMSNGFDFPVGKPNAKHYYNAQKFQENNHLGDDWNGIGGGNSDLGDPIYSIANGYISEVKNYEGGWGNIVRVVHFHNNTFYESLYAHCDSILVKQNEFVKKGTQIATIGNCNGYYLAHLHLEIRNSVGLDIGPGYSPDTTGYLDPTKFIKENRQ